VGQVRHGVNPHEHEAPGRDADPEAQAAKETGAEDEGDFKRGDQLVRRERGVEYAEGD
jgi:hypothetical protein